MQGCFGSRPGGKGSSQANLPASPTSRRSRPESTPTPAGGAPAAELEPTSAGGESGGGAVSGETPLAAPLPTLAPALPKPQLASTPFPYPDRSILVDNVEDLVELARWGNGKLLQVLWSPGGRFLAAEFSTGVYFYDAATLELAGWIDTPADSFTSLVFSPSGTALAAGFMNGAVKMWSVPQGQPLRSYPDLGWQLGSSMSITPDDAFLVVASAGEVSVWRIDSGQLWFAAPGSSGGFALSPDGARLAVPGDQRLVIYDVTAGSPFLTLEFPVQISAPTYAPDGQSIALAVTDASTQARSIRVIRAADGVALKTLEWNPGGLPERGPLSLAFSPDSAVLAAWTVGYEKAQLWKVANWESLLELEGKELAFSPDGTSLAAWAYNDPTLRLYRTADGAQTALLPGQDYGVIRGMFSPSGDTFAAIYGNDLLRLWDARKGRLIKLLGEAANDDRLVAFSPGEAARARAGVLAAVQEDGSLSLWRVDSGEQIKTLIPAPLSIQDLAFSPGGDFLSFRLGEKGGCRLRAVDGSTDLCFELDERPAEGESIGDRVVAALSPDAATALALPAGSSLDTGNPFWLVDTARPEHEIRLSLPFSLTLAGFPADSQSVVLVSPHGQLAQYSTRDGSRLRRYALPLDGEGAGDIHIEKAFLSPDGEWLAASASDRGLRVWKVSDGSLQYRLDFQLEDPQAVSVVYSPDSSLLLASAPELPVGLFQVKDGAPVQQMALDDWFSRRLAFFPGGEILASAAQDRLKFWQVSNGLSLGRMNALDWITGVAVSPDGKLLATVTEEGVIQIWGVEGE